MQDTLDIVKKADQLIKKSEYQSAIDLLNEAIEGIEQNPILYEVDYPLVYKKFGQCYGLKGDIEKANEYFQKGLVESTKNLNITEKCDILASLAFLELHTGDLYKALKYASKSEDMIGEKRGKRYYFARANTFKVLGDIHFREGDIKKAEDYYKKARIIFRKWKLEEEKFNVMLDIITIRILEESYIQAGLYLEEGILEKIETKCPNLLYRYYLVLSKLETATKQYKYAQESLEKALSYAKEHNQERAIAEIYEMMADLNVKTEDFDTAKDNYNRALERYKERSCNPHVERIGLKLGDIAS